MLEECGLNYEIVPVDLARGDQFAPAFLAISPNNKIPALVDPAPPGQPSGPAISLFESGVILEYLAEKCGRFLPGDVAGRYRVKQWLSWQMASLGPMAGQAHHFRAFAPEQVPYAISRYTDEVNRLYGVLDRQLAGRSHICGEVSIADFACLPWVIPHDRQGQRLEDFPHVQRWFNAMMARDGVQRALKLGNEKLLTAEQYALLLGQTADKVAQYASQRTEQ